MDEINWSNNHRRKKYISNFLNHKSENEGALDRFLTPIAKPKPNTQHFSNTSTKTE